MKSRVLKSLSIIFLLSFLFVCNAQAQSQSSNEDYKVARKWCKAGTWRNGFKPTPHKTTDYVEFQSQYSKNQALWDKLFAWLSHHDLLVIKPGTYEVEGKRCFVKISDVETRPLEKCKVESHRKYIDLQYVAKGTERFGRVYDWNDAKPIAPYRPDIINYTSDKVVYMDSNPKKFFLFFPRNLHLAMAQAGKQPEKVRLIVAKIEYAE